MASDIFNSEAFNEAIVASVAECLKTIPLFSMYVLYIKKHISENTKISRNVICICIGSKRKPLGRCKYGMIKSCENSQQCSFSENLKVEM